MGDGVTTFSVFGLFDGHNGSAAAIYTKENLLTFLLSLRVFSLLSLLRLLKPMAFLHFAGISIGR
jgi:hypothetical protein